MAAKDDVEALLREVVKENGRPVVLSRYGFKIVELDGRKYMMAMTKEEFDNFVDRSGATPKDGFCIVDDYAHCYPQGGCRGCTLIASGGHWGCICIS